jgi:hypothetical protein
MSDYNPIASLKVTKMIFTAIFIGPLVILTIFLLSFDFVLSDSFSFLSPYNIGVLAIIAIGLPVANHYSKKILESASSEDSIQSRMGKFQTALIIRLAGWEALALFSIVAVMENPHVVYMAFFIVAMGSLFINYPSISNLEKSIPFSSSEAQDLRK